MNSLLFAVSLIFLFPSFTFSAYTTSSTYVSPNCSTLTQIVLEQENTCQSAGSSSWVFTNCSGDTQQATYCTDGQCKNCGVISKLAACTSDATSSSGFGCVATLPDYYGAFRFYVYPSTDCSGNFSQLSYYPTGRCTSNGAGQYILYSCDINGNIVDSVCPNSQCTNCTVTDNPPNGCSPNGANSIYMQCVIPKATTSTSLSSTSNSAHLTSSQYLTWITFCLALLVNIKMWANLTN